MAQYKQKLNPLSGQFNLVPSAIITFKASVANFAALPMVGNTVGDARITEDTDHWWSWDGSAWNDQGIFVANNWENINGRPSSSVADIDSAVSLKHNVSVQFNKATAAEISALPDKVTPVDADVILAENSASGTAFSKIKITWANIKATLKSYFDTLYELAGAVSSHAGLTTGVHGVGAGTIAKVADIATDSNLSVAAQDAITKRHASGSDNQVASTVLTDASGVTVQDHIDDTSNPHSVTKTQVGLGNVDDKSEATIITDVKADSDVASAISLKHTQGTDLGLDTGGTNPITAATIKGHVESTSNPHSVTKAQVGLTNADDTSDASKPVSTAQATAINALKHIDVMIDGNGFVITNGVKTPYKFVPVSGTITGWDILASNSDTFSIDILYNETFSSAPASITGAGTKPNVSASVSGSGTDLTNWSTTALVKGGILAFQVAGTPAAATWAVMRIRIS